MAPFRLWPIVSLMLLLLVACSPDEPPAAPPTEAARASSSSPAALAPSATPALAPSATPALAPRTASAPTLAPTLTPPVMEGAPSRIEEYGAITGPATLCDPVNGIALEVPAGWYATTPPPGAMAGLSILTNYPEAAATGAEQEPGWLKLQLGRELIEPGSFDRWVGERIQRETAPMNPGLAPLAATPLEPFRSGSFEGVAYTIEPQGERHPPMRVIYLHLGEDRALIASFLRADSTTLDEGLALLASLRERQCGDPAG